MAVGISSFNACSYHNLEYFNPDKIAKCETPSKSDTIHYESVTEMFSEVYRLNCIDDYLIISNENKDTLFTVIDMRTDSVVAKFGCIGHARNEFLTNPFFIYCLRDKKQSPLVGVLDQKSTKIIDLKKSIEANKCILADFIKEDKDYFFYQPYHLNDSVSFVHKAVTYKDARDNKYFPPEFYMTGKENFKWNIYPDIIEPKYPNAVDAVYSNMIMPKPDGSKILCVSGLMDIVMLFDLSTKTSIAITNPNSYTFSYVNENSDEASIKNTLRFYHGAIFATDSYFGIVEDKILYLDHLKKDDENGYSTISLYNWDGKLEKSYVIDKKVHEIAYCERNKTLYAISYENRLFKYKL